jgi:hypothetical protein
VQFIIDFISKAVNSWVYNFQLWPTDKPVIEETIIPLLLTSVVEDIAAPCLLGFLQNGLPIAVSKNAPLGVRHFYSLWQDLLKGVILLMINIYIIL